MMHFPSLKSESTLNAKIFGRFNFRKIPYGPKILVSENYGDIYKAFNILTESVKMSENLRPKYYRPKILAVNVSHILLHLFIRVF